MTTKVERLRIAGKVAPVVRGAKDNAGRVAVIDAAGNVVGYTTRGEVRRKLLERAKIELDVERPYQRKTSVCVACGHVFVVLPKNTSAKWCPGGCLAACADCNTDLRVKVDRVARFARGVRCKPCAWRRTVTMALPPDVAARKRAKQSASVRARLAQMSPEQKESMCRGLTPGARRIPRPPAACVDCGVGLRPTANLPSQIRSKDGKPRCRVCGSRAAARRRTVVPSPGEPRSST